MQPGTFFNDMQAIKDSNEGYKDVKTSKTHIWSEFATTPVKWLEALRCLRPSLAYRGRRKLTILRFPLAVGSIFIRFLYLKILVATK